jgi:hypothetical protein
MQKLFFAKLWENFKVKELTEYGVLGSTAENANSLKHLLKYY